MKKPILILLVGLSFNLNAQIDTHTSREIDSLIIDEGGPLSLMSIKSEERQKEWQILNRNFFSSKIARYKLFNTKLIVGKEEGKRVYIFSHTHCWKKPLGCIYITTDNKFIRDDYKVKFNISRDEAIKKLKEAKDLLDIEMMTREEFDKLKEELVPIIKGSS